MKFIIVDPSPPPPVPGVRLYGEEMQAVQLELNIVDGLAKMEIFQRTAVGISSLGLRVFAQVLLSAADALERHGGK